MYKQNYIFNANKIIVTDYWCWTFCIDGLYQQLEWYFNRN